MCQEVTNICVNLTKPEIVFYLEIKGNRLFIVVRRYEGLGGLPIGTQQASLSLISGGFDSAVSSYMLIRRGCIVHYCFFDLVKIDTVGINNICKIIYFLWTKFSYSHNVKLIFVDFSVLIREMYNKIRNDKYTGIILKRFMMRAASLLADRLKIKSLITGESLGQVSTQTLDNLILINNSVFSDHVVFRPLIAYDKESIIALARKIGTEELSKCIPEYCGIVSEKTSIKVNKKSLELEEKNSFSYLNDLLEESICRATIINTYDIPKFVKQKVIFKVEVQTKLNPQDIVLDIRTEYERNKNPIKVPLNIKVEKIPFYNLIDQFPKLDTNKVYLLYCDKGIMSRLQAIYLYQQGFRNIKIYEY